MSKNLLVPMLALLAACGSSSTPPATTPDGATGGSGGGGVGGTGGTAATVPHTLFATEGDTLVAFDVDTGAARPGTITNVTGPTDLQATDGGYLVTNLTAQNKILIVDAAAFKEVARVNSSAAGATRPVHGYLSPWITGEQFWLSNNDGESGMLATNSLRFVDVTPGGANFGKAVGEVALGLGHHKNALSPSKARVSASNIGDCNNIVQVIDYSDATQPKTVKKWTAAEIDPARDCAMKGAAPHGAAAASNGRAYHNLTGWGVIASLDQDKDPPTLKLLETKGDGGGYTKAAHDGRYVYSLQRTPREGDATRPGKDCQIGNLVVIDSQADAVILEVPLLFTGGDCTSKLPAYATGAQPDHVNMSKDGKTLFIETQAAPPTGSMDPAYSDQELVFDLSDPAKPVQKPSVKVGAHSGHRSARVTGDGLYLFVVNGNDKTISQVEIAKMSVMRTLTLKGAPAQIASFGTKAGASAQTGPGPQ